ncbi:MAG: transcriptional repressor [Ruminobacter sp.]|jgi:Fur family ferric uptake transcriptional regulator|nr:transcriptional repressor [Ruminobacter sp.]
MAKNKENFLNDANECFTLHNAKTECLDKLRNSGVRLSKQRLELIDLLFSGTFNCTKELYYEARARNPELGMSTVYRFLKVLSDLDIISNNKMLNVSCTNCSFKLATFKGKQEFKADTLDIQELVRLGMVVKGLIKSDEKIDISMQDDEVTISIKDE